MNPLIRVGPQRMISIRYVMKNSSGETLINTLQGEPVKFLFGAGQIIPELEGPLAGLKKGERKIFTWSENNASGLNRNFHFDVMIEDIQWVAETTVQETGIQGACGPECDC